MTANTQHTEQNKDLKDKPSQIVEQKHNHEAKDTMNGERQQKTDAHVSQCTKIRSI